MIRFVNKKITMLILLLFLSSLIVACSPSEDKNKTNGQSPPVEENLDTSEGSNSLFSEDINKSSEENVRNSIEPRQAQIEGNFTMMQAVEAFFDKYSTGQIESIEYKHKGQRNYQYEIEGYAGEQEIELIFDANNGDLLSEESDSNGNDGPYLNFDNIVSVREAYDAAISAMNENNAQFDSWQLDMDDKVPIYSFDFDRQQGDDFDIDIHAETMEVMEFDD